MRTILLFGLLFLFPLFTVPAFNQDPTVRQVNSHEFKRLVDEQEGLLLDVRTKREFQNGHIENSGNLNYYALDFRKRLLLLPKDKPVYLYCNTGYRSDRAAGFLIRNGYQEVYNLQHGIMEWDLFALPVAVDPDARPDLDDKFDPAEFAELINSEPVVFVDFYAPWCGPCRQMMPMIDSLMVEYHERIPVVKVNADASKQLMREMKLVTVPYLVLYQDGAIVFEHRGVMKRKDLVSILDSNLRTEQDGRQ